MQKKLTVGIFVLLGIVLLAKGEAYTPQRISVPLDESLIAWIKFNLSPATSLPLSFYIDPEKKSDVYARMGKADSVGDAIERMIVEEGIVIYDAAVAQIALAQTGRFEEMYFAQRPMEFYWKDSLGEMDHIRAGFPLHSFIYDPAHPEAVSSDPSAYGRRGFIFRILNAHGRYLSQDPLDGKTSMEDFPNWPSLHWEDWKPIAGENAWVALAALHLYHQKYFNPQTQSYDHHPNAVELQLAEELARAAMLLQAHNGGIRMAPLGTYHEKAQAQEAGQSDWWYTQISTENNLSWYAAFRMLFELTGNEQYHRVLLGQEHFFKAVFNWEEGFFFRG